MRLEMQRGDSSLSIDSTPPRNYYRPSETSRSSSVPAATARCNIHNIAASPPPTATAVRALLPVLWSPLPPLLVTPSIAAAGRPTYATAE